ncbi:MAG: thiamine phosphate synthase [Candidatus Cloacimonadaceae bacterium]|jgi:thiamine-phosphate pyrophosphorylase|nr:thiamine phosphate synthase [Candidatus Cloacimonadota bacterium]MDX9949682.1 thiamine phosphate synthase [Candidatus Syntrophosphaera sp.]
MKDFGLYIVMTKPRLGYREFTKICVEEEVPMLQLRDKTLCDREYLILAEQLRDICKGSQTRFLIDDRLDLCLLADADGLHLGPDDIHWLLARKLLPDKLIGVSTHSLGQFEALNTEIENSGKSPDYISFGPVFPTVAKAIPDPPVGTLHLAQVIDAAKHPIVAIGGIFPSNLEEVLASGAKNICMIRHFGDCTHSRTLRDNIRTIKDLWRKQ